MRRVRDGKYTLEDFFLLFEALDIFEAVLLSTGQTLDLLNFSLANDIADRVSSALAVELDRRLKKLILGDENYVLGDATKKAIVDAVKSSTGKGKCAMAIFHGELSVMSRRNQETSSQHFLFHTSDSYSFGDLTKILYRI
eukprot:CCRYP_009151-RA/>CCRYP_009151-RA protein AED:0.43 eAED:0.49 QI:0/0/0/1/0/0/3/0/139